MEKLRQDSDRELDEFTTWRKGVDERIAEQRSIGSTALAPKEPASTRDPLAELVQSPADVRAIELVLEGPQSSPAPLDPHAVKVTKALKGANGKRVPSAVDDSAASDGTDVARTSVRKSTASKSLARIADQTTPKVKITLPEKEFSLLRLLVSGLPRQHDEQLVAPETLLDAGHLDKIRKSFENSLAQGRIDTWLKGATFDTKCLTVFLRKSSETFEWADGRGFTCKKCVQLQKPCCVVILDPEGQPVLVAALPEHGKTGSARWLGEVK